MRRIAQLLSAIALVVTVLPACLFFADRLDLAAMKQWMLYAAILWFITAPFWMEHKVT
jgi:hypothetical protein